VRRLFLRLDWSFISELGYDNPRARLQANKRIYETLVRQLFAGFNEDFAPCLGKFSPKMQLNRIAFCIHRFICIGAD